MVYYEWDVELVTDIESEDYERGEVIEHYHQASYADCLRWIKENNPGPGMRFDICLVRDDDIGRSWAYITDGKLDPFHDADGLVVCSVPKRYQQEFERGDRG